VDVNTAKDFLKIFQETKFPQKNYSLEFNDIEDNNYGEQHTQESLITALNIFIQRSSESEKKFLSQNIFKKFRINRSLEINKKAKSLFLTYSQKFRKNSKIILLKKILKWKNFSEGSQANFSGLLNSMSYQIDTSSRRKENEQLKECTFQPNINRSNPNYLSYNTNLAYSEYNSLPAHERLYTDHEKSKRRKMLREIEHNKKQSELTSFSPDISLNFNKTFNNLNKTKFQDRQNNFSKSKSINRERIAKEIEKEINCKYTFSPKILKNEKYLTTKSDQTEKSQEVNFTSYTYSANNTKSNYVINSNFEKTPVYLRLYQENTRRKNHNFLKRSNENFSTEKKNLSHSRNSKNFSSHNHTLQNLYEDHKRNQVKKKKLERNFDEEQGITFKPKFISNNEKYLSEYNFDDRNKKLLDDKQNNIDYHNQMDERKFNDEHLSRKVSPAHYKEIENSIVTRLYNKGLEKMLKRNVESEENQQEKVKNTKISQKHHTGMNINEYLNHLNDKLKIEENKLEANLIEQNRQKISETINSHDNLITKADNSFCNMERDKAEEEGTLNLNAYNSAHEDKIKKYQSQSEKNSIVDQNHGSSRKNIYPRNETNILTTAPNSKTVNNISAKNEIISVNEYTFGKGKKPAENDKRHQYNFGDDFNSEDGFERITVAKDLNFDQEDKKMKEGNDFVENKMKRG